MCAKYFLRVFASFHKYAVYKHAATWGANRQYRAGAQLAVVSLQNSDLFKCEDSILLITDNWDYSLYNILLESIK